MDLAEGETLFDWSQGDLNGDGIADYAVVTEQPGEPEEDGWYRGDIRVLMILLGTDGGYVLGQRNEELVRRSGEGGIFGDPYCEIQAGEGRLTMPAYGGSAWRWNDIQVFEWREDGLYLAQSDESFYHGGLNHGAWETYDYRTMRYTRRLYVETEDNRIDRPLYTCALTCSGLSLEVYTGGWDGAADLPPLPRLNSASEWTGAKERGYAEHPPVLSSDEALDTVWRAYYSDLAFCSIVWSEETYANYSLELRLNEPTHYYEGGGGVRSYGGLDISGEGYEHDVIFRGGADWVSFTVEDTTGEMTRFEP